MSKSAIEDFAIHNEDHEFDQGANELFLDQEHEHEPGEEFAQEYEEEVAEHAPAPRKKSSALPYLIGGVAFTAVMAAVVYQRMFAPGPTAPALPVMPPMTAAEPAGGPQLSMGAVSAPSVAPILPADPVPAAVPSQPPQGSMYPAQGAAVAAPAPTMAPGFVQPQVPAQQPHWPGQPQAQQSQMQAQPPAEYQMQPQMVQAGAAPYGQEGLRASQEIESLNDERFEEIDSRVGTIEEQLEVGNKKIVALDARVDMIAKLVEDISKSLKSATQAPAPAPRPAAAAPRPAPRQAAPQVSFALYAIRADRAWLRNEKSGQSHDVGVGETLPGAGVVERIDLDGSAIVLRGGRRIVAR